MRETSIKNLEELVGRYVKYMCPETGCVRFGILKSTGNRVKDTTPKIKEIGVGIVRVKSPTVLGVSIEMHNRTIQYVPERNLLAWMYFKKERALDWRPEPTIKAPDTQESAPKEELACYTPDELVSGKMFSNARPPKPVDSPKERRMKNAQEDIKLIDKIYPIIEQIEDAGKVKVNKSKDSPLDRYCAGCVKEGTGCVYTKPNDCVNGSRYDSKNLYCPDVTMGPDSTICKKCDLPPPRPCAEHRRKREDIERERIKALPPEEKIAGMICPECGQRLWNNLDFKYCPYCGWQERPKPEDIKAMQAMAAGIGRVESHAWKDDKGVWHNEEKRG